MNSELGTRNSQPPLPTVGEFLRAAAARFAARSPSPRLDAEVIAMHVCGLTRAELITRLDTPLCQTAYARLEQLLRRRAAGEPIAYVTGKREFWSLELRVTPEVLIPRPETELLVERALARLASDAHATVADLGTGSGAVALAIAKERPHCRVVATDRSEAALAVARDNAARFGIKNVEFRIGAWFAPLADAAFDLIVSNPPYLRADDPHLTTGDVRFEPRAALVAGPDGLAALRIIVRDAGRHLRPRGGLLLEHGWDQGAAVRVLLQAAGYRDIATHRDLSGQERLTEAQT
jgi:release factor glutamine methyltransferase